MSDSRSAISLADKACTMPKKLATDTGSDA